MFNGSVPSSRYDQKQQSMLIPGGNVHGTGSSKVWTLNLMSGSESWERLYPSGTPPAPRQAAYAVYHPIWNSMIIFK